MNVQPRHRLLFLAACAAGLMAAAGARAGGYTFTFIPQPPGTPSGDSVQALAINDNGQILVSALNASGNVDVDDIYNASTKTFTAFPDFPGAVANTSLANGINDSGEIVGQYTPPTSFLQSFAYNGGVFQTLPAPAADNFNFAAAVSNNGLITGNDGTATTGIGFIDSGGTLTFFSAADPATFFTTGEGINNAGTVVGIAGPLDGSSSDFSFVDAGGVVSPFSVPGEAQNLAFAINDAGAIAGVASNDGFSTFAGFVDNNGSLTLVNVPGSSGTEIRGINDLGDVVGEYFDQSGNGEAFLATPGVPEPASWATMLVGLGVIGAVMRMSRRSRKVGVVAV